MTSDTITIIATIVTVASLAGILVVQLLNRGNARADTRLERMTSDIFNESPLPFERNNNVPLRDRVKHALPQMASYLLPDSKDKRSKLQARLAHSGFYSQYALSAFVTIKVLMMVVFPIAGLLSVSAGLLNSQAGLITATGIGLTGFVLPGLWLDHKKAQRQKRLRRAIPDYLDLIVACLGSGLSIDSAIHKVTEELETVHSQFSLEMRLIEKEMKLGRSRNEAFLRCAERTDLDELRSLGLVFKQANEIGSSVSELLRIHSDTLRTLREHRAEELAQKATDKILIPTLLFIFPAMFVVLIGPAVMQIKYLLLDVQ